MNNKILAVVLSIIAVIVVFYQIFLRKDDNKIKKNIQNKQIVKANVSNNGTSSPLISTFTEKDVQDPLNMNSQEAYSGMLIDLYSQQLLKRIEPYVDQSKVELNANMGNNIFGYKEKEKEALNTKVDKEKPVLILSGIIEIIKNKIVIAIINDQLYRSGEIVDNAVIEKIEKYRVLLKFNKETIILTVNQQPYEGWIKNGGKL